MTLNLNQQQRINLILLMGAQRANVADMRTYWRIQDRIELTDQEKQAINYKLAPQNGFEVPVWDREAPVVVREFDFADSEAQKLRQIINEWPSFMTTGDRVWLAPLLDQLPEVPASPNGR